MGTPTSFGPQSHCSHTGPSSISSIIPSSRLRNSRHPASSYRPVPARHSLPISLSSAARRSSASISLTISCGAPGTVSYSLPLSSSPLPQASCPSVLMVAIIPSSRHVVPYLGTVPVPGIAPSHNPTRGRAAIACVSVVAIHVPPRTHVPFQNVANLVQQAVRQWLDKP